MPSSAHCQLLLHASCLTTSSAYCSLVTAYFFLPPHASRLLLSYCQLVTGNCQILPNAFFCFFLPTGDCPLPTSSSRLMPHAFFCLLPTGNWRLPTANFPLRFANLKTSATPQKRLTIGKPFFNRIY